MTPAVFADTAYYLALISPRDALHARAVELSRVLTEPVVTTAWVVQELADGLCSPPARVGFLRLLAAMQADPNTSLVEPDPALWRRGLALYRSRPDKHWSLTDCLSFDVMRQRQISRALTSDRHFTQAGFVALLAPTS
jgi:predicted nucleic acid-binding protein